MLEHKDEFRSRYFYRSSKTRNKEESTPKHTLKKHDMKLSETRISTFPHKAMPVQTSPKFTGYGSNRGEIRCNDCDSNFEAQDAYDLHMDYFHSHSE